MPKRTISTIFIYILIGLLTSGFLETTSGLNQKGNKLYEEKRYTSALESYRKAQIKNPDDPAIRYNLGTTLYQLDQFQEAEMQLHRTLENAKTKDLKGTAWYNYGNTQYRLGQFDQAAEAYRKTLDINPNDKDAKYNLEVLQKKKSMFDLKQNKRDEERKNNPPPSSEQQQQQQGGGSQQQQEQKENQSQDKQKQDQNQSQQEKEDQKSEQEKELDQKQENEQGEDQKEEEQKDQQDQKNQEKSDQSEAETEKNEVQEQEAESQPMKPAELEPKPEGQKQEEQEGQQPKPLLQGQMSKENALRILDALKESEQELQSLRQPRRQSDREPLKDW